ncbi:hypothetical protein F4780DRAFT_780339 [Xylariomycetidae sp. FL0641]|nr:hypothetical protein F4780DRAFT_780339 [Xylariomycetidae sp. FL0641]
MHWAHPLRPGSVAANDHRLTFSPLQSQPAASSVDTRNGDPSGPALNGTPDEIENKQIAEIFDELVNSAEASVSGGSDTETSKAGHAKSLGDKGHVRTSSTVKKPQSFKAVSVNRTFLASKTASSSTSRPESTAGSPSSTPQPTPASSASRLKLVAKSGSNLGGSTKVLSTNGKAAAPDGSSVWNKNRPVPPPEPKKLSDEQLKNDGIHMAARLGPEDLKGQSNWADIEDDEEWAPDTITWTDGTKITLADDHPPNDEPPPPSAPPPSAPPPSAAPPSAAPPSAAPPRDEAASTFKDSSKEAPAMPKSKSPVPTSSATVSPSIRPGVLASGKGLVLKGAPEKPTLVAKPPAPPTPAKSPWATLPPVEKVSPVVMDLPHQVPPSRYPPRDPATAHDMGPPMPTKEIAADDFSRSPWKDSPSYSNRELFNSHSGRYEPVSDRRGVRNDHPRQPAVLQRPMHHEQQGPAEPSAAFQTSRMSGQDAPPYGRRRGSSNVSAGSGNFAHRLGPKPHDLSPLPDQAGLAPAGSVSGGAESPVSTTRAYSPVATQSTARMPAGHMGPPRPSPSQVHATPQMPSSVQPLPSQEEIEQAQKKYMRDRREQAIRRRIEEEQREEQARKARIAEKLKALGPAPERASEKKDRKEEPLAALRRTSIPAVLAGPPTDSTTDKPTDSAVSGSSPAKHEVDPESQVAAASEEAPKPSSTESPKVSNETAPTKKDEPTINGGPKPGFGRDNRSRGPPSQPSGLGRQQSTGTWPDTHAHPERFQSWTRGSQNVHRNVWGAPGNDRSLGNGTFNADIGTIPDSHPVPAANPAHRPTPIGPPSRGASHGHGQPMQPRHPAGRLGPIGTPRDRESRDKDPHTAPNPWRSFDAAQDDAVKREHKNNHLAGVDAESLNPVTTDTWRSIELDTVGKRADLAVIKSTETVAKSTTQEPRLQGEPDGFRPDVAPRGTAPPGPMGQHRSGSRFFPSARDAHQQEVPVQQVSRNKTPTPPPPTADGHPAYDGDAARPHVSLPPQKVVVKLPPSSQDMVTGSIAPPAKPAPISFAAAAATPVPRHPAVPNTLTGRPVSRGRGFNNVTQTPHEIALQENWQYKINSLMGKKSLSPPKSLPVNSSTIPTLEYAHAYDADTTVSLPGSSPSSTEAADALITSKVMAVECFDEQEMGSLPAVRLPTDTPAMAWQPQPPNWASIPHKLRVDATVAEPIRFPLEHANGKAVIRISAPEMIPKTVAAPPLGNRVNSNPRRQSNRGGSSRRSTRGGGRGGRDASESRYEQLSNPSSTRQAGRGRREYRSRGDWGRRVSATSAAPS